MDDHTDDVSNEIFEPQKDVAFWKEAVDDEIGSLTKNNTWVLSDLTPGCKPLGCKWIFKRRMKFDETIDKFKARLKFSREDCSSVSTPMHPVEKLKPNTGKPVDQLEYSRAIGCLMYAMTSTRPDIAYVVGRLNSSSMSGWVFLLEGSTILWAFKKQTCITSSTIESEFVALAAAESRDAIFDENRFSSIPRPKDIIPNVQESKMDDHTDDVSNEIFEPQKDPKTYNKAMQSRDAAFWKEAVDDEIGSLTKNNTWVLSDLPPGCKPLGCKWIFKRRMKFDETIDKFKARLKFSRKDCSSVSTPMDPVEKLKPNTGKPVDQLEYSRAIGCLMYAMTSTRPDIAYAVGRLTLVAAGKEAEWLRNLIHEILMWPKPIARISTRCDSAPTMARAYSQIYNGKSRHLGARSKGTTYVNIRFTRFKKLELSFLYAHQRIGTHGL
nr:hypothetical protein [Tanacetum cinerariifolium]